jgi:5''-3'' exonuclease (including N-terminal domain of PolI)
MKSNVIMDVSNLLYSAFHAFSKEEDNILLALANKSFMDTINKNYQNNPCDEVVLAFDGKKNWRKSYTNSPLSLTYKKYKGNRRQNLTDSQLEKLKRFDEFVLEFKGFLKDNTGLLVLFNDRLEADDLIAGYVMNHAGEKHVIISQDRDYLQLLRFPDTTIIDPKTGKQLTLADYDHDPDYFMFQKCIRGDASDNVMSALPRVRETKIKAAYASEFDRVNLMKTDFEVDYIDSVSGIPKQYKYNTQEVFLENERLMDLTKQPEFIKELIDDSIEVAKRERGTYNMVEFLRYCNRLDFQHIIRDITKYNKLLKGPSVKFRGFTD